MEWKHVDTALGGFWTHTDQQREELAQVVEEQSSPWLWYRDDDCRVHRGNVVVDVGAHLGVFTRVALLAGAETVVAIEPAPDACEAFRRTFAGEIAGGRVQLVERAAWSGACGGVLRGAGVRCGFVPDPAAKHAVLAVTIDELVAGWQHVDFVKLDIEGGERFALQGASRTIRLHKPNIACCVYHLDDDPEAVCAAVRAARSDYTVTCGPVVSWMTRPAVYYFWR